MELIFQIFTISAFLRPKILHPRSQLMIVILLNID